MAKKTRDMIILVLLFFVLYGVIYYNFVLIDAIADVEQVQSSIEVAEKKKKALEDDFKNIEILKRNLEMKNTQNERLEEYLMSAANVTDNIEYVDKLAKLFESGFSDVKIGKPTGLTAESTKTEYYEFGIELSTSMTYAQTSSLVNYIEGGSRKVKVSVFDLKPQKEKKEGEVQQETTEPAEEPIYDIKMKVNMYALDLSSIDKIYEYSRKRFNRFKNGDGVICVPSSDEEGSSSTSVSLDGGSGDSFLNRVSKNAKRMDIDIRLGSFLIAGHNFVIKGIGNSYPIELRQKNKAFVKITFSDNDYYISVNDETGDTYNLSGDTNYDTINMYVGCDFPTNIRENKNLGADIQIINNSGKRVDVSMADKVNRLKITDRNGNEIFRNSQSEKVYII